MTTENIDYRLGAKDTGAVAAFQRLRTELWNNEKALNTVGRQGKLTSTALKDAAGVLGPEFQLLGDRIDHISGALADFSGAGLLAKASLASLVAVGSFEVGNMLGNLVFQTAEWTKQLEEARTAIRETNSELAKSARERAQGLSQEQIQEEIKGTEASIARLQAQIDKSNMAILNFSGGQFLGFGESDRREQVKNFELQIEQQKALREAYRETEQSMKEQAIAAAKAEQARIIESSRSDNEKALQEIRALEQAQADYLGTLDAELVRVREGEEAYLRLTLEKKKFSEETIKAALARQKELDVIRTENAEKSRRTEMRSSRLPEVRAEQQRFLTRGPGMKGEEKLLAALKEQIAKEDAMLAEQKKQTKVLENRLPRESTR